MVAHDVLDMEQVIAWLSHYGEEEAARFVLLATIDGHASRPADQARAQFRVIEGDKD